MYCMHCGEQIADNSNYCKYCGKFVAENEITDTDEKISTAEIITENADVPEEVGTVDEVIYSAPYVDEEEEKVKVIDDIFFEHFPRKKKIGLFFIAVFMTAIVAVIVFAIFFPELMWLMRSIGFLNYKKTLVTPRVFLYYYIRLFF